MTILRDTYHQATDGYLQEPLYTLSDFSTSLEDSKNGLLVYTGNQDTT